MSSLFGRRIPPIPVPCCPPEMVCYCPHNETRTSIPLRINWEVEKGFNNCRTHFYSYGKITCKLFIKKGALLPGCYVIMRESNVFLICRMLGTLKSNIQKGRGPSEQNWQRKQNAHPVEKSGAVGLSIWEHWKSQSEGDLKVDWFKFIENTSFPKWIILDWIKGTLILNSSVHKGIECS